jgi:adenylate kinase family enzyme
MMLDNIDELLENSVILLVGCPLAGKSTQGKLLGKAFNRPYVSSGDLFRNEVNS